MPREKATVTLDRRKVATARALVGGTSTSEVIDVALDRLIRAEQLKHDVAAYRGRPLDEEELRVADLPVELDLADDDVDYDQDYARRR